MACSCWFFGQARPLLYFTSCKIITGARSCSNVPLQQCLNHTRSLLWAQQLTTGVSHACQYSTAASSRQQYRSSSCHCCLHSASDRHFSSSSSSINANQLETAATLNSSGSNIQLQATAATPAATAVGTSQQVSSRPALPHNSLDRKEAAKFAALADKWWDKQSGPFAPLHALNAARCSFLRSGVCSLRGLPQNHAEPLKGLTILDVGCGGGLLSEPVARMGANVHGIDVSDEGVAAAAAHAAADPLLQQRIRYQKTTLEQLTASGASYDIVMASEVIEHVRRPQHFMADLAAATRPGGQVFITTLNRTPASYALAIVAAEYVLGFVPRGTHDWSKFITPQELAMMATDAGLKVELLAGMTLHPSSGDFSLGQDMSINYAALLSKPIAADEPWTPRENAEPGKHVLQQTA